MHPSRVAHTSPGSQAQKCSCRHLTPHTDTLPCCPPPRGLSPLSRSDGRNNRLNDHMHVRSPGQETGGGRARARGPLARACRGGRTRTGSTRRLAPCRSRSGMRGCQAYRIIIAPLQNSIVRHLIVSPEVGGTVDGARAVRKLAVRARWRVTRVAAKITFVVVRGVRAIPLVVRRMHPPVLARAHFPVLRRVDLPTRRAAHQKVAPPATRRAWYGRARARRAGCREH